MNNATPLVDFDNIGPLAFLRRSWQRCKDLWRRYRRLHLLCLGLGVVLAVIYYAVAEPAYTAEAVIGPPSPSPTSMLMASTGASSAPALARRVMGGGLGGASNDPYQEYMQLVPSSRLAQALIDHDHLTARIFAKMIDPATQNWKEPGLVKNVSIAVKKLLGRPYSEHPDVDDLNKILGQRLSIKRSDEGATSFFAATQAGYMRVSFRYSDPREAEEILDLILGRADQLIRDDMKNNVVSRISYMRKQLDASTMSSDERSAMIAVLSDQEQLLAMLQADSRYATTLVVPPHAGIKPSSPPPLLKLVLILWIALSAAWLGAVTIGRRNAAIRGFVDRFERRPAASALVPQ